MRADWRRDDEQPEGARVRVPKPPTEWEADDTVRQPATRRERETMMRQVRQGNAPQVAAVLPRDPSRGPNALQITGLVVLGAFMLLVGVFAAKVNNISGGKGITSVIGSVTNPRGQFPADKNRVRLLLIGKDFNYLISKDPKLNGQRYTKNARSDSIMYATLDLDTRKVSLLSIPRDTYVSEHVWMEEGGERRKILVHKINGTYLEGPRRLSETLTRVYGLPQPDYFVEVKIPGVQKIVDAVGGVEVETIDAMQYHDNQAGLHIDLPKGKQWINGKQAIGFARFREADIYVRNPDGSPVPTGRTTFLEKKRSEIVHSKEEGDPRRMARQQQLIRAMANRVKSMDNLLQVDHIINVGLDQVDTNLERMQIFALAALFRSIKPEDIESGTMPGDGGKVRGTWYFIPDKEKCRAMVEWLVEGKEQAANRVTTVTVLNGTRKRGAAAGVAERLRAAGFDVRVGGNADREAGEADTTQITYTKATVAARAEKVRGLVGGGTLAKDNGPDTSGVILTREQKADVTVVVGKDVAG
jgi:polyisoprenyl-teichoic acid--peptidoglycan teichoic acid transferase